MTGLILQYAFNYTDENRSKMKEFKTGKALEAYLKKQNTVDRFATFADKNGLKRRNLMIQKSHKLLERYINSRIIYNMLNEQAWTEYLNQDDPAIIETLRIFREGKAFPQKPDPQQMQKNQKVAMAFDYRGTHVSTSLIAHA
jgi:carboxyl-terminal processing protease